MTEAATTIEHEAHPPYLAHHFETPAQQFGSAKLGMWVFLGTEILMFGGLFCAYGVYRYSHPDVFKFAHQALNPLLGGINTAVLIASSFTMALGVRCAQLGQKRALATCLLLTILGGAGFMCIKYVEYKGKWEHHLFPGRFNVYNAEFQGDASPPRELGKTEHGHHEEGAPPAAPPKAPAVPAPSPFPYTDPLAGTPDEPKIKAPFVDPSGLSQRHAKATSHHHVVYDELNALDRSRINAFFSVYFCMTGLHGFHVLVGMALITWVLIRAVKGEFGPAYFTPVDLVGLYWHLVDLIWIFLFPLLYLIH